MTNAGKIFALFGTKHDERCLSTSEIAERVGMPKGSVGASLSKLVSNGDLVRARYGMYHLPDVNPPQPVRPAPNGGTLRVRVRELESRIAALEARLAT